jgi:transposase
VDPRRAWNWMKRLGFAPLRPRPRHRDRDLEEGEAFKKNSFVCYLTPTSRV